MELGFGPGSLAPKSVLTGHMTPLHPLLLLSCVRFFVTLWTVDHQCPQDFPGKNTGVGCHFLLQGNFPSQGSNLCLLHCQGDSFPLSHQGSHVSLAAGKCGRKVFQSLEKSEMKEEQLPLLICIISI